MIDRKSLWSAILLGTASSALGQINNEALGTSALPAVTSGDRNVSLGDFSGTLLTSGSNNTFIGERAAGAYTDTEWGAFLSDPTLNPLPDIGGLTYTAWDNTFIGFESGLRNRTGSDNTFIGKWAGRSNNATDNTFIGTEAGQNNTTGSDNTFVGEESGEANTTGRDNTFVGEDSGFNNTDGDKNTAIGADAMRQNTTGRGITAIGYQAGYDNSTGIWNTSVGEQALTDTGIGVANTGIGAGAGGQNEHADFGTFIGFGAGTENNRGRSNAMRNTCVGALAGSLNDEGSDNVIIGAFADYNEWTDLTINPDGQLNIGSALFAMNLAPSIRNASNNVLVGAQGVAGSGDSVAIGYQVRAQGDRGIVIGATAQNTHLDSITIGYGATSHGDNIAVIGNPTTASIDPGEDGTTALGSGTYRYASANAKTYNAIADTASSASMSFVADQGAQNNDTWRLQAANSGAFTLSSFATGSHVSIITAASSGDVTVAGDLNVNSDGRLKENVADIENALDVLQAVEGKTYHWKKDLGRDQKKHYGLIAQEVEKVVPELVTTNDKDGIKSVNYQGFVPILINAVDELKKQNERQSEEIELLRQQISVQQELLKKVTVTPATR